MADAPLLVFDFDGVLVDGMAEYWWSARRAALALCPERTLPEQAPPAFSQLRPLIHKGWEMVLAALELSRPELNLPDYLQHYDRHLQAALVRWQLEPHTLQRSLEELRQQAIASHPEAWLALHQPYPGVIARLQALSQGGTPWRVLTTKGGVFAQELLQAYGLQPEAVDGHEQGSKPEVLLQLSRQQSRPIWFVEDRRPTLERVRSTAGLEAVRCFLVTWGYLSPGDLANLPAGISPLEPEQFSAPLASWL
jgi:phosphoglycolate phosphatase-like HAD superfamily hydrolase